MSDEHMGGIGLLFIEQRTRVQSSAQLVRLYKL